MKSFPRYLKPSHDASFRTRFNRVCGATRNLVGGCVIACLLFALMLTTPSDAQAQPPSSSMPPPPTTNAPPSTTPQQRPRRVVPAEVIAAPDDEIVRVETDLVLLDVTVTDAEGKPVRGLRPEDFKLYDDGVERNVSFFNVEQRGGARRPVAVVFALDVSGSMTPDELERLSSGMRAFTRRLAERASVFAVTSFGMRVRVLQSFTGDQEKLARAFERLTREPNGLSTHTYDAVDDAVRLLTRAAPRTRDNRLLKRAVVVVTDGFPVGDTVAAETVIERANQAGVSVYTVTLPSFSRLLAAGEAARAPLPTPLDVSGLAEKTGGTSVYAVAQDFDPLFRALAEEVTSTYVLAFYPPEEKRRDHRFHAVRVTAPPGLTVRQSRPGYQGTADERR